MSDSHETEAVLIRIEYTPSWLWGISGNPKTGGVNLGSFGFHLCLPLQSSSLDHSTSTPPFQLHDCYIVNQIWSINADNLEENSFASYKKPN